MKQKSINLLSTFLNKMFEGLAGFTFTIDAHNDYDNHWECEVVIKDELEGVEITLQFKVSYLDDTLWIQTIQGEAGDGTYEQVEEDRWNSRFFWYAMYCSHKVAV